MRQHKAMTEKQNRAKKFLCMPVFIISGLLLLICELFRDHIFGIGDLSGIMYSLISSALGIILCMSLIFYCEFSGILKIYGKGLWRKVLCILPCWVIAINNFPIIPFALGQACIDSNIPDILLFALQCLFVGIFEELAYRGCVFMLILRSNRGSTSQIFSAVIISSALFGVVHIVNLFAGGGPIATLLQVGYSFLIGAMCCFVLLRTGSIWHCALIHAVYNFCGGLVANYGTGSIWTIPEVILTIVVSLIVAVYVTFALLKTDKKYADALFN